MSYRGDPFRRGARLEFLVGERARLERILALALKVAVRDSHADELELLAVLEHLERLSRPIDHAQVAALLRPTRRRTVRA